MDRRDREEPATLESSDEDVESSSELELDAGGEGGTPKEATRSVITI